MDGIVVDISDLVGSTCQYCQQLDRLHDRRFYSDDPDEPFIIIENLTTLTPILLFCEHAAASCIDETLHIYKLLNGLCGSVLGDRYYLCPDDSLGHFAILSFRIFM